VMLTPLMTPRKITAQNNWAYS